ncbi:hypothetical protein MCOR27_000865 [Pyricularia oryzae]|uniref:Ribosome biogenesis protein Sqt1 n=5 Tax=Pyricularia TaxID=48558 RepID=G5EH56_PYRO7|nr:ribosome biogenesis protein Sqt1 [Pyricularia oryzae 70-15]ELQ41006.1 ribosome biogenesis protein Sqt1 [Pyricularia oryzae Y34]KAH8838661.1 hypothetical protein MCOR01_010088 [Pyricularia oryzae]KAI6299408.1 hypothetical protein MCOR33_004647 [Pyricularia grisea]EAQ71476.1 hypothetical protein MGCH7_ch7g883 [Pyricularia oryzae 70-15]EHA45849.1 ribosome biogenesis protein Sqt1 [Pyricularia oryzae 70-15]
MSSSKQPHQEDHPDSEPEMLAEDDALEEIDASEDVDVPMDSDDEGEPEEINLHNDGVAYFDLHKDSVFAIAQHPTRPTLIATGGSEGDSDDAPGKGYVFDTAHVPQRPLLPPNFSGEPPNPPVALDRLFEIDGHTDSINALTFTYPEGEYLLSGGMDGKLRAYAVKAAPLQPGAAPSTPAAQIAFLAESQEVPEINFLSPCPNGAAHPNVVALGASDGSVWVYQVDGSSDPALQILQSYFLHTGPATACAWTPDGEMLATVSEDGSLYVWDVFGTASAAGLKASDNGMSVLALTTADQRFEVEGGLYSVSISPTGAVLAVGGAGGAIKVVSLPRIDKNTSAQAGKRRGGPASNAIEGGQILASLHAQGDGVETLSFSQPGAAGGSGTLLAAGSVDGSIAIYDAARNFQVRRLINGAHGEFSVVKVDFVKANPHLLTSCGMDGVVRRWDARGGVTAGSQQQTQTGQAGGLLKEWRGHRGDGEGGGVLGFVQGEAGERVATAGDDGVVLIFEA